MQMKLCYQSVFMPRTIPVVPRGLTDFWWSWKQAELCWRGPKRLWWKELTWIRHSEGWVMLLCSYTNDCTQDTPTLSSLQRRVLTLHSALFSHAFSCWTTWTSTYEPLSHALISVLNMYEAYGIRLHFMGLLCAGSRSIKQSPVLPCPCFMGESRRALPHLAQDVHPCNKKSTQEVKSSLKRVGT